MPISNILILGGGICGLATAIALSKTYSQKTGQGQLKITIYELRDADTIASIGGGAVNLTPTALRHLEYLGVSVSDLGAEVSGLQIFANQAGKKMGVIDFSGDESSDWKGEGDGYGGFKGVRVMRKELHAALLDAAVRAEGVGVVYGKKVVGVVEGEEEEGGNVQVKFGDGTSARGDLAIGTDGIHSATRMRFVEPERVPEYSGLATAQALIAASDVSSSIHFKDTAVNVGRRGSLLTTFCNREREMIYLAAVMEMEEPSKSERDGYKANSGEGRGGDQQDAVKKDIADRFSASAFSCVREMIAASGDWFMFPVYTLASGGRWCTKRVMLLGDAAHAMPPQGESIGLALEDAVLFSRVFARHNSKDIGDDEPSILSGVFKSYEDLRRGRIDEAYREAAMRWESAKDSGFIGMKMKEFMYPWILWFTSERRKKAYMFDASKIEIS
ncbi:hypothetical protein FQN54_002182 [Arachnomyces sp. PD_36]|nr:hypothetical protein FQN54_002182 [Arachnomyces sp. PD_36]